MMLGIGEEAVIFFYAVFSGIVVFSSYRILELFRKLVRHHIVVVGAEDVCYWVGVSIYLFRQMYHTTHGSIRWFFVLGILCGSCAAYSTGFLIKKICGKWKKTLEKRKKSR